MVSLIPSLSLESAVWAQLHFLQTSQKGGIGQRHDLMWQSYGTYDQEQNLQDSDSLLDAPRIWRCVYLHFQSCASLHVSADP